MTDRFIKNILDIPHTVGMAIIDDQDCVLVKETPSYLDALDFSELGRRAQNMFDTVEENFMDFDDIILKYESKLIYLRRFESLIMVILTEPEANMASVKMVTNLAKKSLNQDWIQKVSATAPKPTPAATPTPAPPRIEKPPVPVDLTQDSEPEEEVIPEVTATKPEPVKEPAEPVREKKVKARRPLRQFRGSSY